MKTIWPKIALLLLCCAALGFELWHFRPSTRHSPSPALHKNKPDFVLLPAQDAATLRHLFGNDPPVQTWEPTLGDIEDVEGNLSQISELSRGFRDQNRSIVDAHDYYRQYLAVDLNGKNVIFVNALCRIEPAESDNWRKHFIDTVDGGKCFWKATYDPTTHKFSNLIVNGMG